KPTGEHMGTLKLKEGYVMNDHGNINNGRFIMDMTSIVCTDIEDEGMRGKLEGHLKSEDFFNTAEFPDAFLQIKKIEPSEGIEGVTNNVIADLTIKGKTATLNIPANISWERNSMFVYAEFTFDRSKFDVKYGLKSFFDSLGDKFINDDVEMTIRTQLSSAR
ncbi:MAG: YceI family protein, partial [Bacteroidia bacterium]|nr:YceI family protein [Bacteroidia bacterium]